MAQPSLLREELKRTWHELRGRELSPARGAAAVALGLFIGSQPIFGCHTPLVVALCVMLRLDAAICWVASNISNPFVAPFLISAEVQLGGYLHTGAPIPFDHRVAAETGITGFATYAFTGAPFIGLALAAVGGGVVWGGMTLRRRVHAPKARKRYHLPESAPPWWHAAERVAARYSPDADDSPKQRSNFHYVRIKLLMDPVMRMIADLFGEDDAVLGEVLDIGTGRGQLPMLLLELGRAERARGLDWDEDKIADASEAARIEPELRATFEVADAATAPLEPADTVLMIDLLHYLSAEQQDALLDRAAAAVRPGGRLVIRDADTEQGWRSAMTWIEERVFTTLRFNRGARVKFRAARTVVARLEAAGMTAEVRPAWGSTPFSNVLIIGARADGREC